MTVCSLVVPTECGGVSPVLDFKVNVDDNSAPITVTANNNNYTNSSKI